MLKGTHRTTAGTAPLMNALTASGIGKLCNSISVGAALFSLSALSRNTCAVVPAVVATRLPRRSENCLIPWSSRIETVLRPCTQMLGQPDLSVDGQCMKIADPDLGLGLCEGGHPDRRHAEGRARCCNELAPVHDQSLPAHRGDLLRIRNAGSSGVPSPT